MRQATRVAAAVRTDLRPEAFNRAAAIERAVLVRDLHRRLAREFSDIAPPGRVLAMAVRVARGLQRGGCAAELVPAATEQLVRASMAVRSQPLACPAPSAA